MLKDIKERAGEIKKSRMAAELLVYENKVEQFLNFNVVEELNKNASKAAKELKTDKILNASGAALYIGLIGTCVLSGGLAGIIFGAGIAYGGAIMGGLEATINTISNFNKTAEQENIEQVQNRVNSLEYNLKNYAVEDKVTIGDYFRAARDSLKTMYVQAIEKQNNKPNFAFEMVNKYNKSVEQILEQRENIRTKSMAVTGNNNALKN